MKPTWKPHEEHGKLSSERSQRAPRIRLRLPRQAQGADDRRLPRPQRHQPASTRSKMSPTQNATRPSANIHAAAKHYNVDMPETSWHDLGEKPHTPNPTKA